MQSEALELKKKYSDEGHVSAGGHSIEVHSKHDGTLLCSISRDAHGGWNCNKLAFGARDSYRRDAVKDGLKDEKSDKEVK